MRTFVQLQKELFPDLTNVLRKRYMVLRHIMASGVIGRRLLAVTMNMSERVLRAEVDVLKAQGLIQITNSGMTVSELGLELLQEIQPLARELFGLCELESQICRAYGLRQAIVVPGDSHTSPWVKKELGRAAAQVLSSIMTAHDVIAVTGGSTMAEVATHLKRPSVVGCEDIKFIPARGGLEERVELQANTIAAVMAKNIGAQYRLLHVPDVLSEHAYASLQQDPNVQKILYFMSKARIVFHGIGDAIEMARRRKLSLDVIENIYHSGAVAEAFGYYFNHEGKMVYRMRTLGMCFSDIKRAQVIVGVAGGKNKIDAIQSFLRVGQQHILITDEAAAEGIVQQFLRAKDDVLCYNERVKQK